MLKSNKKTLYSIKFTIFTVFSVALLVLMSVIISVTYFRNTKSALTTADQLMDKASQQVFMKIENLYEPLLYITDQAVDLPILGEKPTLQNHPAENFLINTMKSYPQIQILYIGYNDGDFYEILSFEGRSRSQLQDSVGAPREAQYGILRQFTTEENSEPVRLWKFLNKAHQTIGSIKQNYTGYDPRKRPWYINAQEADGSVKTDPYMFSNVKKMGLTISRKIDGKVSGVLGADILLDEMAWFLEELTNDSSDTIFIFNSDLNLTAFPASLNPDNGINMPKLSDFTIPEIRGFLEYLEEKPLLPEMKFILKTGRDQYLVQVKSLPEKYSNNEYLFHAISRKFILGPVERTAKNTAIISILIVLMAFPIIYIISRKISFPLNKLVIEAGKIGNFDLSDDIAVASRITEIHGLSTEMTSMKRGLRSFNRYVPSKLVKQLIKSGQEVSIGGVSKELTFLFSDIEGFTSIAENTTPENLMKRLSDYFEVLSREIRLKEGTIDKFIGDAVMAFWNAPMDDPNHAVHACEAGIAIQNVLAEMNIMWTEKGVPAFFTRMGINTGQAVVGNMGSMDRMNYTAIGDSVNSCSRLESINKLYGTNIIIGDSVVEKIDSRFLYRPLENIIVKGKTVPQAIYELIGYKSEVKNEEEDFAELFTEGFNSYYKGEWMNALSFFQKASPIRPEDRALLSFKKSCVELLASPPPEDWTGIRILRRK
ncbi:MAG: hypothetical protein JEY99_13845 [Spirochaetales bacterium]|nr:hypothetical protein [Spirochaetales bacterium]